MSEALELRRPTAMSAGLVFDDEQRKMIREMYAPGSSESEFRALIAIAEARKLNPLLKQIYFVKRWDSNRKCETWAVQGSIDGLRAIAQRTNLYDGQDDSEFEYGKEGNIILARVRVYRKDVPRAFVGTARWTEYVQTKRDGSLTNFWATKPHIMLAKCAEALALRKAFPEDTGGIYVPEEMGEDARADAARDVTPAKPPPALRGVVPDEAPAPTTTAAPTETPTAPAGEIAADQVAVYEALLNACNDGFDNQIHKEKWLNKHRAEIVKLPGWASEDIRRAFDNAPIGASKEK